MVSASQELDVAPPLLIMRIGIKDTSGGIRADREFVAKIENGILVKELTCLISRTIRI